MRPLDDAMADWPYKPYRESELMENIRWNSVFNLIGLLNMFGLQSPHDAYENFGFSDYVDRIKS